MKYCECVWIKSLYNTYLDLIALFGVKSHPLIVLGSIGYFLVLNPLNGGTLHKATDLDHRQYCTGYSITICTHGKYASWYTVYSVSYHNVFTSAILKLHLIVGPESSFSCVWTSWCSTASWGSNASVWWRQTEGTAISCKSHPQLLHWGAVVPPVSHCIVLRSC